MSSLRMTSSPGVAFVLPLLLSAVLCADEPASLFFVVKGEKIHYLVAGKGEPVVLIHGLHSSAEVNWKNTGVIKELAADHQVIALDLLGHGLSDKPQDEAAYGLQVVEDIVLLLDHLQIKQAHIVGYSLGGIVAVKLMASHPDRVLSGTVGGMGWLREGSALQKVWGLMPRRQGGLTPAAFVKSIGKLAVTEADLKDIDIPVKVLVGDRDPVKQLYVIPLHQVRQDWPVVEIADAGHINCILKPQFRAEIARWVKLNTKPPADN